MSTLLSILSPFADIGLQLAGAAAAGVLALAAKRGADWLGVSADDSRRAYLMTAVDNAVVYAMSEARRRLPADLRETAPNVIAADAALIAADYVRGKVPDALRRLGVSDGALAQIIQARMNTLPASPAHVAAGLTRVELLRQFQVLAVYGLGILVAVALWMLRNAIRQEIAEKTATLATAAAVKAIEDRVDTHDGRLASMEAALRHLPTAEQMSALNLLVADLRGEVRAMRATVEGMEKVVGGIERRVELIDEHLKRSAA